MRGEHEGRYTRPRCVVIFASEDDALAKKLADAISGMGYDGWSAHQIAQGRWDIALEQELASCDAVVPLVTRHTRSKEIFRDEWSRATENQKPIFPFVIDPAGTPLGFGGFSRTDAPAWDGSNSGPALDLLNSRLRKHFEAGRKGDAVRVHSIATASEKTLELPAFIFSLSGFETQLNPLDGIDLIAALTPCATLVSAYDLQSCMKRPPPQLRTSVRAIVESRTVLFLDSGNYEATRKSDHKSKKNASGWCREKFWEVASGFPADFVFSYDPPENDLNTRTLVKNVIRRYVMDLQGTGVDARVLCPIVHIPTEARRERALLSGLITGVARELRPSFVAIPERELGDGLVERMRSVKSIRAQLNERGFYQPIHILGTGNPISIAALAACGADSFDGLEWCRTAANYEANSLMHFQQFDLLLAAFAGRMKSVQARALAELESAPFSLRAASYNYDYFEEWVRTVRRLLRSGDADSLFKIIPNLGIGILNAVREGES